MAEKKNAKYLVWLEEVGSGDVERVGGKNASLGEMIRELKDEKISVPDGFATTADGYRDFLKANELEDKLRSHIEDYKNDKKELHEIGRAIRQMIIKAEFPSELNEAIKSAYRQLGERYDTKDVDVAVRSSGTAEDLPEASFAGQQESFLNVSTEDELLEACKKCYASLFTDRAISYRQDKGFDHMKMALSVGVQKMIRSDKASAGVMFTLDPETGFSEVVIINGAWGLGESVVAGKVTPDEFMVYKPLMAKKDYLPIISRSLGAKELKTIYSSGGSATTKEASTSKKEQNSFALTDKEVMQLARWGEIIEKHYERPMDIEWAKDGNLEELFIVQARPETVHSQKNTGALQTFRLQEKGEVIITGLSIGQAIASGKAQLIENASEIRSFKDNAILVTGMTDPDWEPIMKRAAGIVTDHGGRTSHAAIVSRELGIPAVVGTGGATRIINEDQEITISCAEGDEGKVYEGKLEFEASDVSLEDIAETDTQIMMNIASPAGAFRWWQLPCKGIGLARLEFIIGNVMGIHPMALVRFGKLEDKEAQKTIEEITWAYEDKSEYFVDTLALGIARIAASRYPSPVIVRTSDFKTNEYATLIGGAEFEPEEENPMIGFRGASRYYSDRYREGFALECRALKRVREEMGFTNVVVMIPFCRTLTEAEKVLEVLAENGLERGRNGLELYVMAEVPSNIIQAEKFAEYFDGFSIGSNDLTQLTLGVDRDSSELAYLFDEGNEAVKASIARLIEGAHKKKRKVGLCGQAPSDHPDFASFLVKAGIDSISVNPDSLLSVVEKVAETEKEKKS